MERTAEDIAAATDAAFVELDAAVKTIDNCLKWLTNEQMWLETSESINIVATLQ